MNINTKGNKKKSIWKAVHPTHPCQAKKKREMGGGGREDKVPISNLVLKLAHKIPAHADELTDLLEQCRHGFHCRGVVTRVQFALFVNDMDDGMKEGKHLIASANKPPDIQLVYSRTAFGTAFASASNGPVKRARLGPIAAHVSFNWPVTALLASQTDSSCLTSAACPGGRES